MSTPRFQGGRKKGAYKGEAPRPPKPGRGRGNIWGESRPSRPREYTQTLPSDRDRMSMLSGQSDPPFKSRYGGRDEYDPVDAGFNRQFNEAPRGRQPWDSDPRGNPLERDPLGGYDVQSGRDISSPTNRNTSSPKKDWWNEPKRELTPSRPSIPPRRSEPSNERVYAGGGSPIEGISGHDYINNPKYRNQRKKSIINSPTQDLNKRDDCPC